MLAVMEPRSPIAWSDESTTAEVVVSSLLAPGPCLLSAWSTPRTTAPTLSDPAGLIELMNVVDDPTTSDKLFGVIDRLSGTHPPAGSWGPPSKLPTSSSDRSARIEFDLVTAFTSLGSTRPSSTVKSTRTDSAAGVMAAILPIG